MTSAEPFARAAEIFADLVERIPSHVDWGQPALGVWDLRSLVGHTSRALITVDSYLDRPASVEAVPSVEAYFAAGLAAGVDPAAIAERGRQAGQALGADPVAAVRSLVQRVLPKVTAAGDPLIETIAGGMTLHNYLATRTFELVVHSLDIAHAAGLEAPAHPDSLIADVVGLAARLAVLRGQGQQVLLALTGRSALPAGFGVL